MGLILRSRICFVFQARLLLYPQFIAKPYEWDAALQGNQVNNWRQVKYLIAFLSAEQFVKNLEVYVKLFYSNLFVKKEAAFLT